MMLNSGTLVPARKEEVGGEVSGMPAASRDDKTDWDCGLHSATSLQSPFGLGRSLPLSSGLFGVQDTVTLQHAHTTILAVPMATCPRVENNQMAHLSSTSQFQRFQFPSEQGDRGEGGPDEGERDGEKGKT